MNPQRRAAPPAVAHLVLVRRIMRILLTTFGLIAFTAVAAASDYSDRDLVGRWYRGDHLGYNLILSLSPDHTYKATWSGDEIDPKTNRSYEYGNAKGKWTLKEDPLVI